MAKIAVGSGYRSEIFYTTEEQRRVAEETIPDVDASGHWPGTVVTEITEAGRFWEAVPEEQDYFQRYPGGLRVPISADRCGGRVRPRLQSATAHRVVT